MIEQRLVDPAERFVHALAEEHGDGEGEQRDRGKSPPVRPEPGEANREWDVPERAADGRAVPVRERELARSGIAVELEEIQEARAIAHPERPIADARRRDRVEPGAHARREREDPPRTARETERGADARHHGDAPQRYALRELERRRDAKHTQRDAEERRVGARPAGPHERGDHDRDAPSAPAFAPLDHAVQQPRERDVDHRKVSLRREVEQHGVAVDGVEQRADEGRDAARAIVRQHGGEQAPRSGHREEEIERDDEPRDDRRRHARSVQAGRDRQRRKRRREPGCAVVSEAGRVDVDARYLVQLLGRQRPRDRGVAADQVARQAVARKRDGEGQACERERRVGHLPCGHAHFHSCSSQKFA